VYAYNKTSSEKIVSFAVKFSSETNERETVKRELGPFECEAVTLDHRPNNKEKQSFDYRYLVE